jgi:hypothetical protein
MAKDRVAVESGKKSALRNVFFGAVGVFFLVGDRTLREFGHFSLWGSLIIWAGVLGVLLVGWVIYANLSEA